MMNAFEAAVAGGVPIIKALREGLTANRIEWIAGIINGPNKRCVAIIGCGRKGILWSETIFRSYHNAPNVLNNRHASPMDILQLAAHHQFTVIEPDRAIT